MAKGYFTGVLHGMAAPAYLGLRAVQSLRGTTERLPVEKGLQTGDNVSVPTITNAVLKQQLRVGDYVEVYTTTKYGAGYEGVWRWDGKDLVKEAARGSHGAQAGDRWVTWAKTESGKPKIARIVLNGREIMATGATGKTERLPVALPPSYQKVLDLLASAEVGATTLEPFEAKLKTGHVTQADVQEAITLAEGRLEDANYQVRTDKIREHKADNWAGRDHYRKVLRAIKTLRADVLRTAAAEAFGPKPGLTADDLFQRTGILFRQGDTGLVGQGLSGGVYYVGPEYQRGETTGILVLWKTGQKTNYTAKASEVAKKIAYLEDWALTRSTKPTSAAYRRVVGEVEHPDALKDRLGSALPGQIARIIRMGGVVPPSRKAGGGMTYREAEDLIAQLKSEGAVDVPFRVGSRVFDEYGNRGTVETVATSKGGAYQVRMDATKGHSFESIALLTLTELRKGWKLHSKAKK